MQTRIFVIFSNHMLDLAYAVETGEGFGDLGADGSDLDQRCGHQPSENHVHEKVAERHLPRENGAAAHENENDTDSADDNGGKSRDTGNCRHRSSYVAKEPMRATGEDQFFALLRRISLDDANPAQ